MYNRDIIIRDASPKEARAIAEYFVSAWPVDTFLAMDGHLTEDDLKEIVSGYVAAEDNLYSYRNTMVAVCMDCDGKELVAGAINGYDGKDFKRLKKPVTDDLTNRFGEVPYASVEETGPGEFYLDSVGVAPDMRSKGIGSMLFEAMLRKASENGHEVAGLLVDHGNPKAEALYARLGFEQVDEVDFLGHRMKHLRKKIGQK